jgi:hypothetical protein
MPDIKLPEVTCLSLCTANNFEEDALVVCIASLFHVSYLFSLFFFYMTSGALKLL